MIAILVKGSVQFINFFLAHWLSSNFRCKNQKRQNALECVPIKKLSTCLSVRVFKSLPLWITYRCWPSDCKGKLVSIFFLTPALCRVLERKALMKISSAWFKRHERDFLTSKNSTYVASEESKWRENRVSRKIAGILLSKYEPLNKYYYYSLLNTYQLIQGQRTRGAKVLPLWSQQKNKPHWYMSSREAILIC